MAQDKQRLAGWDAFSKDGKIYAAPVTLQGHPIYYNKALYKKAGLDPEKPADHLGRVRQRLRRDQARRPSATASPWATRRAIGIQFWLSGLGSGILTPAGVRRLDRRQAGLELART